MQQDLQSKDLQIETPCDEPTQGKIVTLLWYLECVMDHVCKGFFSIYATFRQYNWNRVATKKAWQSEKSR